MITTELPSANGNQLGNLRLRCATGFLESGDAPCMRVDTRGVFSVPFCSGHQSGDGCHETCDCRDD